MKSSPYSPEVDAIAGPALDPAQQSFAEALRVSFTILKLAMLGLLVAFAFSGTFSVGSNEVAVRLRFGDYVGGPGNRVLERGTYFAAPFPIEQVIKVDTRPMTLALDKDFWFETADRDSGLSRGQMQALKARPLHPVRDGSLITGDSNIVHARWTITWRVADPVAYITNVGSTATATDLVRCAMQQGIVHAVAHLSADDLLRGVVNRESAIATAQRQLEDMRSGVVIDRLVLDKVSAPLSVAASFDAVTTAESDRAEKIVEAQQDRARILGEAAGEAADKLFDVVTRYERARETGRVETATAAADDINLSLDSLTIGGANIGGEVARIMNAAKTYRTQVVERVKTEAETFRRILPEYTDNPRIVMSRLWEDARENILTGDVETFYVVPGQLHLLLNRDQELQKTRQQEQLRAKKQQQSLYDR